MMVSQRDEDVRTLLHEERVRLEQIRLALSGDQPEGLEEDALEELSLADQHPADHATELFERERDLSILDHVDEQLADVQRALERLEAGTYGTCEACGRPIGEDRLRARPAARLCIDDQARAERAGA